MPFGDEDETGQIRPAPVPSSENPSGSRRRSVTTPSRSTISHPPAYRSVVAVWPVEWRERWGRVPTPWKKTACPGAMRKPKHSWKFGTSFASSRQLPK